MSNACLLSVYKYVSSRPAKILCRVYLGAYPENLINRVVNGQPVWASWYTIHKIFAGLLDTYLYTDNKQALDIATKMASWAYQKLSPLSQEQLQTMMRNEFGGMNEVFYNLYAITGNE